MKVVHEPVFTATLLKLTPAPISQETVSRGRQPLARSWSWPAGRGIGSRDPTTPTPWPHEIARMTGTQGRAADAEAKFR
jgi:hypothetical protein